MTDTPETDAETMRDEYDHVDTEFGPYGPSDTVSVEFARRLERERDELKRELEELREYFKTLPALNPEKGESMTDKPPIYNLHLAEQMAGLHDKSELEKRVKWVNRLRTVVGRRMPKNVMGVPLVSDIDLLFAHVSERVEALESIDPELSQNITHNNQDK